MDTVTPASPPSQIDWTYPDERPSAAAWARGRKSPGRVTVRPRTGLTSRASWGELLYALIDLAPAVFFFAAILTLLCAGAGLTVVYVGIPVLIAGLLLARLGGALQIGLARTLLGMPVLLPGRFERRSAGPTGLIGAVLRDAAAWRAVFYFLIKIVLAPITFAVAVATYTFGLGAVTYPIWRPFLPAQLGIDGMWHRGTMLWDHAFVDTWPRMVVFGLVGLVVLVAAPHVLRCFVAADRLLIAALLGRR